MSAEHHSECATPPGSSRVASDPGALTVGDCVAAVPNFAVGFIGAYVLVSVLLILYPRGLSFMPSAMLGAPLFAFVLGVANAILAVRGRRRKRRRRAAAQRASRLQANLCPVCEYNLTGLTEPRCPECGQVFEEPA